jgi:hypothetical protein
MLSNTSMLRQNCRCRHPTNPTKLATALATAASNIASDIATNLTTDLATDLTTECWKLLQSGRTISADWLLNTL